MRFDPQCGYTAEHETAEAASSAIGGGSGSATGKAVASAAVIMTALLGAWIWQQQMPGVERAGAATPALSPPVDQSEHGPGDAERDHDVSADSGSSITSPTVPAQDQSASTEQPAQTYSFDIDDSDAARALRSESLLNEGKEQLAIGQTNRAIELLQEALRLNPQSTEAHYNLGLAHVLRGDMPAARRERDVLRELDPNLASLLGNLVR